MTFFPGPDAVILTEKPPRLLPWAVASWATHPGLPGRWPLVHHWCLTEFGAFLSATFCDGECFPIHRDQVQQFVDLLARAEELRQP